jgi:hypothetical protein
LVPVERESLHCFTKQKKTIVIAMKLIFNCWEISYLVIKKEKKTSKHDVYNLLHIKLIRILMHCLSNKCERSSFSNYLSSIWLKNFGNKAKKLTGLDFWFCVFFVVHCYDIIFLFLCSTSVGWYFDSCSRLYSIFVFLCSE